MATAVDTINPLSEPRRPRRVLKVGGWLLAIALTVLVLDLLGIDVTGWLEDMWDAIDSVPPGYLILGVLLQVAQTTLNGVAYVGIFRYAYPDDRLSTAAIVTAYAVGVAMNGFLPANIGTVVMLLMYVAIVPSATFAGVVAAYLVHKIFFTVVGTVVYVLLFVQAGDAFDVELGWFRDHPVLLLGTVAGGTVLVILLARVFWRKLKGLWEKAKQGGRILSDPRAYALRVLVPQVLGYAAKIGVIAVFLSAYAIPVTFGSVSHVIGSSSAANVTSVTPGAVGVTQAANAVALRDYTDSATATEYSISQQLVTTATNVAFALVMVVTVFGWTGGRALVLESYAESKERVHRRKGLTDDDDEGGGDATPTAPGAG